VEPGLILVGDVGRKAFYKTPKHKVSKNNEKYEQELQNIPNP